MKTKRKETIIWDGKKSTLDYLISLNNKYKEKFPNNPARFNFSMENNEFYMEGERGGTHELWNEKIPIYGKIILEVIKDKFFYFAYILTVKETTN